MEVSERRFPVWTPFLALLAAFGFAVLVGIRICPTLIAIIYPPDLALPPGQVEQIKADESKGLGQEEKVYGSTTRGCDVAQFYQKLLGTCTYDMESGCDANVPHMDPGNTTQPVAICTGVTAQGDYKMSWIVRIDVHNPGKYDTHFRIIREVAN